MGGSDFVEKMAQARITVSTVALGAAADRDLLAKIAGWGKGRTYCVTDASHVPPSRSLAIRLGKNRRFYV